MEKLIHGGDIYTKRDIEGERLIDFSANINPLKMPQSVRDAIVYNIDSYINYPDPLCRELREAIGKFENADENHIVCGNGAADIIFRIVLGVKPKNALILAPTFAEYEEALKLTDCKINYYDLEERNNFSIGKDILNRISKDLDIMFLCNPNNPTGIPINYKVMLKIANKCKENKVILVVDECFIDFLEEEENISIAKYIKDYQNLIILKAFTKMYAMAGIRLGYMLCSNEEINEKISKVGQPWSVSTVASKCGVAALKEKDFVLKTKKYISKNREYLMKELNSLGFKVFNSKTNYILFKSKDSNIKNKLEKKGILIRSCSNYRNLSEEYFRIAVKSEEDNKILIESIKDIMR